MAAIMRFNVVTFVNDSLEIIPLSTFAQAHHTNNTQHMSTQN